MSTRALADVGIDTARLDSELLLVSQLGLSREWILAHDDAEITPDIWAVLCRQVYERAKRQPVAYLTGGKDFYGRRFLVNPNVLIPRPESEQIIDSLHRLFDRQLVKKRHSKLRLLDIGTGSGCLAITAKLEFPNLDVTATDISPTALEIARLNALRLHAKLRFITSDLFSGLDNFKQDIIIANLPYVDIDWDDLSPELIYEPQIALFAEDHGLELIKQLLIQAPDHLRNRTGYLILEMDHRQIDKILTFAEPLGYRLICRKPFTITLFLPQPTEGEED